ncbi:MAG: Do family serine endopeptidase [Candidatus Electryoneaceae bacterium]|nr:Do family serine endopeptidase [Candidatus Electryoneaceae bacterium]
MKKILLVVVVAFIGGFASVGLYRTMEPDIEYQQVSLTEEQTFTPVHAASYMANYPMPESVPNFIDAADMTVHAVVHIKTEIRRRNSTYDEFFYEFFGRPHNQYNQPLIATGSGVIITDNGYIVTNNHVVQNAERLEVTLNDKRSYEAEIIGTDPSTDLALIKIMEDDLPFITYGDSDKIRVGEWVLAVGNPFNLTSTVTAGIVSAKARDINILGTASAIESFIQTDAPVNRGNSGGALVNTSGELVGINAAIASNTGSYAGYSFAIPVNIVKKVMNDFINYGELQRAYIGVTIRDIDSQFADELSLSNLKGVYVVSVVENSSADDAGIRDEDIILKINNLETNSVSRLLESVGQQNPGDRIDVTLRRDGEIMNKQLLLKNRDNSYEIVSRENREATEMLGATFEQITDEDKIEFGINYGMKIVDLQNGKLMNKGVREGFIITEIDKSPIRSREDIRNSLGNKRGGILIEGVYPNGQRAYFAIGQ